MRLLPNKPKKAETPKAKPAMTEEQKAKFVLKEKKLADEFNVLIARYQERRDQA